MGVSERPEVKTRMEIGIGLMGLGVVGSGVARALVEGNQALAQKVGCPISLKKILIRDPSKNRPPHIPPDLITTDAQEVLADPEVRILVEVMGGEHPATGHIHEALAGNKHVVTANKEVIAKHGPELLALADSNHLYLLFEASVGAGIPIVGPLTRDLLANEMRSIHAIINGTTNYIVSRMSRDKLGFGEALVEAQQRGYAEADPTDDIEGTDAAYKLAVLASLAFHAIVQPEDVYREGISRLEAQDFRYAQELGYVIKLLAIARREEGSLQLRVHPSLVPHEHILASVDGAFNAIEVEGDLMGRVLFHGMGAGREPTTSAVVGDLVEVARKLRSGIAPVPVVDSWESLTISPMSDLRSKYYLRLNVADHAGVLAQIATILGDLDISIASMIQKDSDPQAGSAEIVVTTHPAREDAMQESLKRMEGLEVVREISNLVRIEEWPGA